MTKRKIYITVEPFAKYEDILFYIFKTELNKKAKMNMTGYTPRGIKNKN